jgi:LytS/YehU family sensor histidine kinase
LNSIAALTTADAGGARRMCLLLGEFLAAPACRRAGAHSARRRARARPTLPGIEQVRFGDRLQVAAPHSTSRRSRRVCRRCFCSRSVENAVTHGIAEALEGGTITVDVNRAAIGLAIAIENPLRPRRADADAARTPA